MIIYSEEVPLNKRYMGLLKENLDLHSLKNRKRINLGLNGI